MSTPFEIFVEIILFILILMVYTRKIIFVWNKQFSNKSINPFNVFFVVYANFTIIVTEFTQP